MRHSESHRAKRLNGRCKCHKKSYCKKKYQCENRSLVCNYSKLEAQLLGTVVKEPLKVTRDAFNVATISGGSLAEMYHAVGYEQTRDRLWQMYFNIRVFNGQLATIIGPPGVPNDTAIRKTTYSDAQFLDFFSNFTNITKVIIENYLAGINKRIQDVLDGNPDAPLPAEFTAVAISPEQITLAEYLRFQYHVSAVFGGPQIGFQDGLYYFSQIENLFDEGYTVDDAIKIATDLYDMKRRRANGVAAECTETLEEKCDSYTYSMKTLQRDVSKKGISQKGRSVEKSTNFSEIVKNHEELEKLAAEKGIYRGGSYGINVSGKHTLSGKPLMMSGPQVSLTDIPGFFQIFNLRNKELGIQQNCHAVAGLFFFFGGTGGLNDYSFSVSPQVGDIPATPPLLQDPELDNYLRTDVIQVRGDSPVDVDVYDSPYKGFVTQQGVTSPLYEGTKSLVLRNLDYGKDLEFLDALALHQFSSSYEELRDTLRGPGWTTGFDVNFYGHDNRCNNWAAQRAGWYDFEETNIIPQGVLGNPIPPAESVPKRSGYIVKKTAKGYNVNWNTAAIQCVPSVNGDGESSRVQWLDQQIEMALSKGKLAYNDLQNILIRIGNANQNAEFPYTNTEQNSSSDCFHYLFKDRFFQAVSVYPTADRLNAVDLLKDFDGSFIEGDELDIFQSPNLSDKWLLAQQWSWEVQAAILEPIFGGKWADYPPSSSRTSDFRSFYTRHVLALVSRLLGTSPVSNPVFYPDWLSGIPDIDLLIVEALDTSLATLGGLAARPWGNGTRPKATYSSPILGPIPFNGSNPYTLNRSGLYYISEMGPKGSINASNVSQIGQSGLILFEEGVPVVQDTAQQDNYLRYQPNSLDTIVHNKCHCHKRRR